MLSLKTLISAAFLTATALANSQIAVYWGQNGYSGQDRLSTYCESSNMDIVLLSFLNDFPEALNVNFANQCGGTFPDSDLLHCDFIGEDIKTCQSLGKKVLLSLGGAIGTYGFDNEKSATDFADVLWNKFGGGCDDERPFDDAVVDGFDFDIESGADTGYAQLAIALREKFAEDSSKSYYLSAAPQCVYPDAYVGELIAEVPLDYIFIQFYNNYCQVKGSFNFDTWQKFAESAPNPNVQLFVGVPGGPNDKIGGVVNQEELAEALETIKCDSNFAGVSLWDASGAYQDCDGKGAFLDQVRDILDILDTEECKASIKSLEPSSNFYSNSSVSATASDSVSSTVNDSLSATINVQTITDIHSTVVTITSCSENKCSATPVTTGYVVVTDVNTVYTTYCPLTNTAVTVTCLSPQSTVTVTTVCNKEKCQTITKTVPVDALPTNGGIVAVGSSKSAVPTSARPSNGTVPVYTVEGSGSSTVAIWSTISLLMLAALF
ncbi:Chitinase 2 [Spathaspora sp. JA1]|nr:Chitinase 2 [Spathaspora sp. JA1]